MKSDVNEPDNPAAERRRAGFAIQIAGPELNFRAVIIDDPKPTGSQIVAAAGFKPLDQYAVLQWLRRGSLEPLRLNETTDLRERGVERFIIAKTDRAFFFILEGERQEWLVPFINGITLKRLAGKDPEAFAVFLDREGKPDREIDDDEMVDLSNDGIETFRFRQVEQIVTIIVNGCAKEWNKKKISFAELVAIAYPVPPTGQCIVYTITYHRGPSHRPEGTLTKGESVRVRDGMVFNVRFTDKS